MISEAVTRANPNCAETYASLRLYGDALDPAVVSRFLRLEPSDSAAKGLTTVSPSGKSRTAPTGRWILCTEKAIQSADLEEHIDWLLDRIADSKVLPAEIPGVNRADVFCYWASATGNGGPEFSPQLLGRLAGMNLTLGLDLYFQSSD